MSAFDKFAELMEQQVQAPSSSAGTFFFLGLEFPLFFFWFSELMEQQIQALRAQGVSDAELGPC